MVVLRRIHKQAVSSGLLTYYRITAPQLINHVVCKQENLSDLKIRATYI